MLFFRVSIVVIASAVIVLSCWKVVKVRKSESQKIDDLPVLVAFWSGALVILSSKVNGPVVHESTP